MSNFDLIAERLREAGIVNATATTPEERRLARHRAADWRQARWEAYRRYRNDSALQMLRDSGMGGGLTPADDDSLQEHVEPSEPDWD